MVDVKCPDCHGSGTSLGWNCGCGPGVSHVVDCGIPAPRCPTCQGWAEVRVEDGSAYARLDDLRERVGRAQDSLLENHRDAALSGDPHAASRLAAKLEGVNVVRGYVDEMLRQEIRRVFADALGKRKGGRDDQVIRAADRFRDAVNAYADASVGRLGSDGMRAVIEEVFSAQGSLIEVARDA